MPLTLDSSQHVVAPDLSKDNVARFQAASLWRARWQVINSFVPYALLWIAMDRALAVSYWLMLPIAILAAGFLVACVGALFLAEQYYPPLWYLPALAAGLAASLPDARTVNLADRTSGPDTDGDDGAGSRPVRRAMGARR